MESAGAQAGDPATLLVSSDGGSPADEKRRTESGSASSSSAAPLPPPPPRRGRVAMLANGFSADGISHADVIEYYTHRDGAIYRATDSLAKLYRLHDTSESTY
jgi:hypothetical protein